MKLIPIVKSLLFCCVILVSQPSLAFEPARLIGIHITGNTKTQISVILNELGFAVGDVVGIEDLNQAQGRLLSMGIFSHVSINTESVRDELRSGNNGLRVHITLEEKWTTIPIAKIAFGGGLMQSILGVYDPNLAGAFLEAGVQYERLGETNSGVLWFKEPRLFADRQSLEIQLWNTNRLRTKYEPDTINPKIKTGFLHQRDKIFVAYMRDIAENMRAGISYEYNDDHFSDRYVNEEVKALVLETGLPPATATSLYGLELKFGTLGGDASRQEGFEASARYRYADVQTAGQADFHQFESSLIGGQPLHGDVDLAIRASMGATNTNVLQYWYYLGGLEHIRGFVENRFAGSKFWLTNTELRYRALVHPQMVLQAVGFWDQLAAGDTWRSLDGADGASIGGGLRLIAPKIYRLVVRLDYAVPLVRRDDRNFSFGIQQFF